jgi:ribose/xylose/arabinose/galactoside ABC-type transport system permease subunit
MPNNTSFFKGAFRRHEVQIAAIVALMAVFFSVMSPGFLSAGNLTTLLEIYSVIVIMAAGLLVRLISGGIDISFAAIAAVTQYWWRRSSSRWAETGSSPLHWPRFSGVCSGP